VLNTLPQRVIFVNRFYSPDLSATSQMLTDLAEALAREGVNVWVLCSGQLYESAHARLPPNERLQGVTVRRLATTRLGRDWLPGRALDYATFYLSAAVELLRTLRPTDVLVVKTDPPLLSVIASWVTQLRGARLVNWLQDLFPEVASRLGLSPLPRRLETMLSNARDRSLKRAHANVVIGARMREYLIGRGVPRESIVVSENWADERAVRPLPVRDSSLRRSLGLQDRFVVAYSGNVGRAHDVDTLLEAATLLMHDPRIIFLMIGGGANMRVLESHARERRLGNFRFLPYQARDRLADSLAAGDVHLVSLVPAMEGLIVPSKLYGILAAGRPVVFIGDAQGELAELIRATDVGVTVSCGDAEGLRDALESLCQDRIRCADCGERARELLMQRFTLKAAVHRWTKLLNTIAAKPDRAGATF